MDFRKHILIVEDEPHIANLYREFIEEFDYQTSICLDGEQALSLFTTNPTNFDLVLTDQTMPNISGNELSSQLLKVAPSVPIIMCTGHSTENDKKTAIDIGIKHYLVKPVNLPDLVTVIDNLLKD
ncbi:hypothetical protein tinsulaeT_17260 [Thalassotalea insulae]|uniref:Response regulatory domain-containing protein n=1 Tax=Thalassotalea insulae TaxID=2056778 RepID=A0ABQ6GR46_9GAMM|nr:response regulator [Thalassotalea insulae]GLX78386.1 hypothetical protein tinsulaeT_17260 [Thalassotalea insulae]